MIAPSSAVRRLLALLAITLAPALLTGCKGWECGYGGPGCGEPALHGLCDATLSIGEPVTVTAVYFDDTGAHATAVRELTSAAPERLEVARGEAEGELVITAHAPGEASVELEIEGWEKAHRWTFTLTSEPSGRAPGACELEHLDPDPG